MGRKKEAYRMGLELAVCQIWHNATLPVYQMLNPIDMLIGMRSMHLFTHGVDDEYDFLVDAVDMAMARAYQSDPDDPWFAFR